MAALSQLPTFQSLGPRKLLSVHLPSLHYKLPTYSRQNNPGICVSSSKKPRANRKVKSNAEIMNDIKEFLSTAGLSLDHVPSTKELLEHGRQDLAKIVRRRGYKYIRELLADHLQAGVNLSSRDADIKASKEVLGDLEDISAEGQNKRVEDLVDAISLSNEASKVEAQTEKFAKDATEVEEDTVAYTGDASLLCQATVLKDNIRNDDISGKVEVDANEPNCIGPTSPDCRCLSEKIDKFLQDGELNGIEGVDGGNGQISLSTQLFERPTRQIDASSPDSFSNEEPTTSGHSEDLNVEFEGDNQAEISRLKFMLHQKELELTHLKEQIEKEKVALSVLQTKAETEISRGQKRLLKKDAELRDAENRLSGLKEVEVEFWGDGDVVEVAGSFNGWHHSIKMDLQPSAVISGRSGSWNSPLWRTVLWLYPGVYEIKFIVDGHWMIDPQRESITKGGVHNNILLVDR